MSKLYESINKGFNRRYLKEDASRRLTEANIEDLDTNNKNPFYFVTSEDADTGLWFLRTSMMGTWNVDDFYQATLYPNMQACKKAINDYINDSVESSFGAYDPDFDEEDDRGYEPGDLGYTFKIYKVFPVDTMNA